MKSQILQEAKNFAKKAQKFIDDFYANGKNDVARLKNLFKDNAKLLHDSLAADIITGEQYIHFSGIAGTAYGKLIGKTGLTAQEHDQFSKIIAQMEVEIETIEAKEA